jgi:hypothetical protein
MNKSNHLQHIPVKKTQKIKSKRSFKSKYPLKVLFASIILLTAFSFARFNHLPTVKESGFDLNGNPQFSETLARNTLKFLTIDIGLRVIGTRNELRAVAFLLDKLQLLKQQSASNLYIKSFGLHNEIII